MTVTTVGEAAARRVAIVGGGLAGLAAALCCAEAGARIELFEARRVLGGRAGSFQDPATGETVDHCQHVSLACCTAFTDFCRRVGIEELFRRERTLHFIAPDNRRYDVAASRWLPAPLHLLPSLSRLGFLSWGERLGVVRAMRRLLKWKPRPNEPEPTVGDWLRRHGQSTRAIEQFWGVVLVSALGASIERCSIAAAHKVFSDGFAATRDGHEMLVPNVPLAALYDRIKETLAARGVRIHLGAAVTLIDVLDNRATALMLGEERRDDFDQVVVAVPWHRLGGLFPPDVARTLPQLTAIDGIESAAITAVHLVYDRPITTLPHAVLVGRLSQWLFARPRDAIAQNANEYAYQVVISAADDLAPADHDALARRVIEELAATFPAAREARLLRQRVVAQRQAVLCYAPGIDAIRPAARTSIVNLFLAGDWTATGWPATMESAIRSGNAAADALLAPGTPIA